MEWLDRLALATVTKAVCTRGSRLSVFVSDNSAEAARSIEKAGGKVFVVPPELVQIQVKLSLLDDPEGSKRIIVRKKDPRVKGVRFIETSDANSVALAETLIAACREIANGHHPQIGTDTESADGRFPQIATDTGTD